MLTAATLFDLTNFTHAKLFREDQPVWSALRDLKDYMDGCSYPRSLFSTLKEGAAITRHLVIHQGNLIDSSECSIEFGDTLKGGLLISRGDTLLPGASLIMAGAILQGDRIALGEGVLVEGGATIKSPTIIGNQTEVRQGAYIRGYCLIGDRCVIGHATEAKHSIFLNDAKAGHFAYLGDSIIGNNANLGAGTKCANLRFISGNVQINHQGSLHDTGMRKFGAIMGDNAQTGCNSVTNPGTIMAKRVMLMPNATAASGFHQRKRIGR